ncbi:TPT domain-containing protein [Favolaschia claudopus]|uniref:TPT domain-containing protein n=1 Tax=Favolaschia claudopus TaxID=2862362 RepID=A0AAW0CUP6_9AGAR
MSAASKSASQASTSRRFQKPKPLLPGPLQIKRHPISCLQGDLSLASNASESPMQAFKLPTTSVPLLHERIRLRTDMSLARYRRDKEATRGNSRSSGSSHRRAYHHDEPYLPSSNSNGSISPSPTELCLLPFNSPASPKLKFAQLPVVPESPSFWLIMYFCFNLGLTLYNKGVLVSFPFPYTLSALHAFFGTIGGTVLAKRGTFAPSPIDFASAMAVLAFSALYAINIAVSNVSLQLVTVPFHQVVRAATPIFTIIFSGIFFGAQSSYSKKISLIPVVAGVGLATFGDYYFSYAGLLLTLFGAILAALKTIFTNVLQTPSAKTAGLPHFSNPFELLFLLSPLALVQCTLMAYATGELHRVRDYSLSSLKLIALLLNGCIAFGLNVVSFSANRRVGALSMTVAANVKQVLTIVCAVVIFNLNISALNAVGILLTLVGGAWYAWIELIEKQGGGGAVG